MERSKWAKVPMEITVFLKTLHSIPSLANVAAQFPLGRLSGKKLLKVEIHPQQLSGSYGKPDKNKVVAVAIPNKELKLAKKQNAKLPFQMLNALQEQLLLAQANNTASQAAKDLASEMFDTEIAIIYDRQFVPRNKDGGSNEQEAYLHPSLETEQANLLIVAEKADRDDVTEGLTSLENMATGKAINLKNVQSGILLLAIEALEELKSENFGEGSDPLHDYPPDWWNKFDQTPFFKKLAKLIVAHPNAQHMKAQLLTRDTLPDWVGQYIPEKLNEETATAAYKMPTEDTADLQKSVMDDQLEEQTKRKLAWAWGIHAFSLDTLALLLPHSVILEDEEFLLTAAASLGEPSKSQVRSTFTQITNVYFPSSGPVDTLTGTNAEHLNKTRRLQSIVTFTLTIEPGEIEQWLDDNAQAKMEKTLTSMEELSDPIKEGRVLRIYSTARGQAMNGDMVDTAINNACKRALMIAKLPKVTKPAAKKTKIAMSKLMMAPTGPKITNDDIQRCKQALQITAVKPQMEEGASWGYHITLHPGDDLRYRLEILLRNGDDNSADMQVAIRKATETDQASRRMREEQRMQPNKRQRTGEYDQGSSWTPQYQTNTPNSHYQQQGYYTPNRGKGKGKGKGKGGKGYDSGEGYGSGGGYASGGTGYGPGGYGGGYSGGAGGYQQVRHTPTDITNELTIVIIVLGSLNPRTALPTKPTNRSTTLHHQHVSGQVNSTTPRWHEDEDSGNNNTDMLRTKTGHVAQRADSILLNLTTIGLICPTNTQTLNQRKAKAQQRPIIKISKQQSTKSSPSLQKRNTGPSHTHPHTRQPNMNTTLYKHTRAYGPHTGTTHQLTPITLHTPQVDNEPTQQGGKDTYKRKPNAPWLNTSTPHRTHTNQTHRHTHTPLQYPPTLCAVRTWMNSTLTPTGGKERNLAPQANTHTTTRNLHRQLNNTDNTHTPLQPTRTYGRRAWVLTILTRARNTRETNAIKRATLHADTHTLAHRAQRAMTSTCQNTGTHPHHSAHQHAHQHAHEHATHEPNNAEESNDNKHYDTGTQTKEQNNDTHEIPTVCSQLGTACSSNDAGDSPETTGKRGKQKRPSSTRGDERFAPMLHRWAKCNKSQTPITGETKGHDLWHNNPPNIEWKSIIGSMMSINMQGWGEPHHNAACCYGKCWPGRKLWQQ